MKIKIKDLPYKTYVFSNAYFRPDQFQWFPRALELTDGVGVYWFWFIVVFTDGDIYKSRMGKPLDNPSTGRSEA